MLDIKFIRENADLVQQGAKNKNVDVDVAQILEIDKNFRSISLEVQKLREERNKFTQTIKGKPSPEQLEQGKKIKEELDKKEKELKEQDEKLKVLLSGIPNLPKPDVKAGKNDTENEIIKTIGTPRSFNFAPKDHLELGELLDIIDVERAAKVSGARFYYLKNEGALLEFALVQLAFETLVKEGFTPILPPVLIKTEIMRAMGYMEKGGDEDMFILPKDDLVLVATSEQSIVPMHKDEVFNDKDLPKRFVGFSSCFRREAGSYGKDTRGIIRVHQFDKIEMVSYTKVGEDDREHEYLLSLEEKLLQALDIPYQVAKMCTGDLGFPAARKYDLEAWIPSQNKYRELTSTSTTTDYQSRRLNIRYRPAKQDSEGSSAQNLTEQNNLVAQGTLNQNKTEFVQILNGTAFSGRPIVAILENYQQEDGTVVIPEALQKYTGFSEIKVKK